KGATPPIPLSMSANKYDGVIHPSAAHAHAMRWHAWLGRLREERENLRGGRAAGEGVGPAMGQDGDCDGMLGGREGCVEDRNGLLQISIDQGLVGKVTHSNPALI